MRRLAVKARRWSQVTALGLCRSGVNPVARNAVRGFFFPSLNIAVVAAFHREPPRRGGGVFQEGLGYFNREVGSGQAQVAVYPSPAILLHFPSQTRQNPFPATFSPLPPRFLKGSIPKPVRGGGTKDRIVRGGAWKKKRAGLVTQKNGAGLVPPPPKKKTLNGKIRCTCPEPALASRHI